MTRALLIFIVTLAGCATVPPGPAEIRLSEDACAQCRMTIVSLATAAQIVAGGEEPLLFDEIGCLRDYVAAHPIPGGARLFVADHLTSEWVDAATAIYTTTAISTPMGSGIIAHRDAESRDADPAAQGGTATAAGRILNLAEGIGLP